MSQCLAVKEYDTIICNESLKDNRGLVYIEEKRFRELEHFIKEYTSDSGDADVLEFMKIGYRRGIGDTITFNNYVGIIELPSGFQIEILPKVSLGDDSDNSKTKSIFLKMLRCLKEFEGKLFNTASLNVDKMNLYEVFINMYIQEARKLVKRGLKSAYNNTEDNLAFFKGKMDVKKQIQFNTAHKERFYMHYDEYNINRSENKLVKSTLLKLLNITSNADNSKEIRKLLYSFELVDTSDNYDKDFNNVSHSRDMKDYEMLLTWSRVFLLNKSFTTFSGEKSGKALLFPMEKVFEAFVAKQLRTVFEKKSAGRTLVSAQDSGYYLFDSPRKFKLRPDIVTRNTSDVSHPTIVMDTKWKRLSNNPSANYGISQADMYQMYAYSKKYSTPDIWLLYPLNDEVRDIGAISFEAIKDEVQRVHVRVFFVDLANYEKSLQSLYELAYYNPEQYDDSDEREYGINTLFVQRGENTWNIVYKTESGKVEHHNENWKPVSFYTYEEARTKLDSIEKERRREDLATPFSLEEAREYAESHKWKFASSYAKSAPHEYLVKNWLSDGDKVLYERFVSTIKAYSVVGYFHGHQNRYLILGDHYYWFMGQHENMAVDLINRTTTDYLEFRDGVYYYKPDKVSEGMDIT